MEIKKRYIVGIILVVGIIGGIIALIIYETTKSSGGDKNKCTNDYCNNNGTVTGNKPDCTCVSCDTGFSGKTCDDKVGDPCTDDYCNNQGTAAGNKPNCTCVSCDTGFSGKTCETKVGDPCTRTNCNDHGDATGNAPNCTCTCDLGFGGDTCNDDNRCKDDYCNNQGTASGVKPECSCLCNPGFGGATCDTPDNCTNDYCNNNGIASGVKPKCSCACNDGFAGETCNQPGWSKNQIESIRLLLTNGASSLSKKYEGFSDIIEAMLVELQVNLFANIMNKSGSELIQLAKSVFINPTPGVPYYYYSDIMATYIINIMNSNVKITSQNVLLCIEHFIFIDTGDYGDPIKCFSDLWSNDTNVSNLVSAIIVYYGVCK
jgi:hypothetical protein